MIKEGNIIFMRYKAMQPYNWRCEVLICVTFRVNYMWGFDMWTWKVLIFVFLSWWVYMVLIHGNKTTYNNDAYMRFWYIVQKRTSFQFLEKSNFWKNVTYEVLTRRSRYATLCHSDPSRSWLGWPILSVRYRATTLWVDHMLAVNHDWLSPPRPGERGGGLIYLQRPLVLSAFSILLYV